MAGFKGSEDLYELLNAYIEANASSFWSKSLSATFTKFHDTEHNRLSENARDELILQCKVLMAKRSL